MLNGDIHCNTYTYMNGYCASTIIIPVTANVVSCVCRKRVEILLILNKNGFG